MAFLAGGHFVRTDACKLKQILPKIIIPKRFFIHIVKVARDLMSASIICKFRRIAEKVICFLFRVLWKLYLRFI